MPKTYSQREIHAYNEGAAKGYTRGFNDGRAMYAEPMSALHAAAPALLDALESMLNIEGAAINGGRLGAWKGLNIPYHFEKARAAIAQARGETK